MPTHHSIGKHLFLARTSQRSLVVPQLFNWHLKSRARGQYPSDHSEVYCTHCLVLTIRILVTFALRLHWQRDFIYLHLPLKKKKKKSWVGPGDEANLTDDVGQGQFVGIQIINNVSERKTVLSSYITSTYPRQISTTAYSPIDPVLPQLRLSNIARERLKSRARCHCLHNIRRN